MRPLLGADASSRDLAGRVCLVTGASSGIGFAIAEGLAARGADLILACRSELRASEATARLLYRFPHRSIHYELVDLATRDSARALAERLARSHPAIHVLVNNAGGWSSFRSETADGIEQTWATNVLGPFLLTRLLEPNLQRGAPSRIINVASGLAHGLELDDVEFRRRPYRGVAAYAQSKQANRMWTWALARRLGERGVTANALHPGLTRTEAFAKGGGLPGRAFGMAARIFGRPASVGADTAVWLATRRELQLASGAFWMDRRPIPCAFRNRTREDALWTLCERMEVVR
jgi:NAD(P)-dependent dehydrogenase (short-subunit alcohol dehydrogenase family)